MKKIIITVCVFVFLVIAGCSNQTQQTETTPDPSQETSQTPDPTQATLDAETIVVELKNEGCPIGNTIVYTEETDPNGVLGRPNQYISKCNFADTTLEQLLPDDPAGGTVETFATKSDCNARYTYLNSLNDPSFGAVGVNAYIYKSDLAILRVSYDITPSAAEKYESAFFEIVGK